MTIRALGFGMVIHANTQHTHRAFDVAYNPKSIIGDDEKHNTMKDIRHLTFEQIDEEIIKTKSEIEFLDGIDTDKALLRRQELEQYLNDLHCAIIPL